MLSQELWCLKDCCSSLLAGTHVLDISRANIESIGIVYLFFLMHFGPVPICCRGDALPPCDYRKTPYASAVLEGYAGCGAEGHGSGPAEHQ